jgi:NAD(P)-dependent dehydrogenase (short-subunit alcohol dehydrogenase family)
MPAPSTADRPRTALVAGGAGALGRAVVARLLAEGERVCAPELDTDQAQQLQAAHPEAADADRLRTPECDATDVEQLSAVVEVLAADWGPLWLACSLVGGFAGGTPVADHHDLDELDRMLSLNARSAFAVASAGLGAMGSRGGRVVLVGAAPAFKPPATLAPYAMSKAAVHALTQTLAREVAGTGRTANAVAPTMIDTPANRTAMPNADTSTWTPAEAIADVVAWLGSAESWTVNGALVPVPGDA